MASVPPRPDGVALVRLVALWQACWALLHAVLAECVESQVLMVVQLKATSWSSMAIWLPKNRCWRAWPKTCP